MTFRILSQAEQVANHLRSEILRGRWREEMIGVHLLVAELGVNRTTVDGGLRLLEKEGLLVPQGAGRRRRIVLPENLAPTGLRVAILAYEPPSMTEGYVFELRHRLTLAGHQALFAPKSLTELGMDVRRVARLVDRTEADAWIVAAAPREVMGWFAAEPTPVFALFGGMIGQPVAGVAPDHAVADRTAVRRLIALGHRRIVFLDRDSVRAGGPGHIELGVFKDMAAHGLPTGAYNLPDWQDNPADFQRVLDQLFRFTPPTALIICDVPLFHAARDHLARRGIFAPEHVSLICTDPDRTFAWCRPTIAHIRWDTIPIFRRVVQWANHIASSKDDRRQTFIKAEFVEGGTVGPVPKGR